jgi:signal transduction histidine kinase
MRGAAERASPEPSRATGVVVRLAIAATPLAVVILLRPFGVLAFPAGFYLPLHFAAELLIIAVGFATFAVQWFAAGTGGFREARGRFVGAALLGGAAVEALHLLVFPGMPGLLGGSSTERGIVYWLAARWWTVAALLAAIAIRPDDERPLLARAPLLALSGVGVVTVVALERALSAHPSVFFVEGRGLTALKVVVEGGAGAVAAIGAWLYARVARASGDPSARRIAIALALMALGSIAFSLYASAYDAFNLLGHVYQVVAHWLVFEALFAAAVVAPHAALQRLRAHVEGELADTIARLETTSRREADARAELEAALAAFPGGLLVHGVGGAILRANAGARRLLALDTLGALAPEDRYAALSATARDGSPLAPAAHPARRALAGETVSGELLRLAAPGGEARWVTASAAPIRGEGGALHGAVVVYSDVTDLQRLQEGREDLLRAVSHDLRNPLQVTLLNAERIVRAHPEAGPERRMAEAIVVASRQMGAILRDLVDSVRLDAGGLDLFREPVAIRAVAEELVSASAGVLAVERVRVEVPADVPPVSADRARLERILANLVGNALKYTAGAVAIAAAHAGGEVQVSVRDEGPGLSPEDLPRLFDRYWRRGGGEGLGLGLYIVKKLVEAHGGWIRAESAPGRGSTFTFALPVAADAPRRPATPA